MRSFVERLSNHQNAPDNSPGRFLHCVVTPDLVILGFSHSRPKGGNPLFLVLLFTQDFSVALRTWPSPIGFDALLIASPPKAVIPALCRDHLIQFFIASRAVALRT